MFNDKNILYLISALSSISKIKLYTEGMASSQVLLEKNNQMNFNASITLLIAIAEEVKRIDKTILDHKSEVGWQNIIYMRNILAHDYRGVDADIVYDVIIQELPKLEKALISLLSDLPADNVKLVLETKQYAHLHKVVFPEA